MCVYVRLTVQTRRGKIDQVKIKKEKKQQPCFFFLIPGGRP